MSPLEAIGGTFSRYTGKRSVIRYQRRRDPFHVNLTRAIGLLRGKVPSSVPLEPGIQPV